MPNEDDRPTSPSESAESPQGKERLAGSCELSLNVTEGVNLTANKSSSKENIILDLFGDKISQIPEAINVDLIAESGIKASVAELLPKLPRQSIDQIIASNPQAFFLEYAAPVLKPGGRIYINATKRNPFGKLPNT